MEPVCSQPNSIMNSLLVFSFFALFIIQTYGLEDPNPDKIAEYKRMVAEWSQTAQRIARSLENRPQEDADAVTAHLKAAMEAGMRHKRDTQFDDFFSGISDTFKKAYDKVQNTVEDIGSKGKDLAGQFQEQVKNIQSKITDN